MTQELLPRYSPKDIEERWFKLWADPSVFHASYQSEKKPYCIVIPPPNVTGILHMGHALNNTFQDILIRFKRMQGFQALWMPGTDHAGIATQNVVERQIAKEGLKRQDVGRENFLKRVWDWKKDHGSTIIHQLKRMGTTCDWPRERFTMDEGYSSAVREAFVRLYRKGLIYRGDYIINWCPRCQTALADEEAPHHEIEGRFYHIKYPLKEPVVLKKTKIVDHLVVATTRPETMLGDTAVAVHPKDARYKHFIGKTIILPLMNREITIIADSSVDKKFGTGAVKVTPAHDPNDYAMGKAHNLEFINIMHPNGVLNNHAGDYAAMDRFEAREAVVKDLKERGLLVKIDSHTHAVGHCYRCHTIVEPYLSKQWFVKMKPLARPAISVVKKGRIKFTPKRWTKVYLNWMENIRDWCISRQIWWGHRLPVWYCHDCLSKDPQKGVIVSVTKPVDCPECGSGQLSQDEDVLDTWFSSWLWPFATFGWPFHQNLDQDSRRIECDYFYPTDVLVTAPEIIFFWVARMIMAGCEFMGEIPFREVYIHGTVRDIEGRKMSKSLGNSINPLGVIDEYGADALRFALMVTAASGSDIFLSTERFQQGRNFANKIWNASRFILMNLHEGAKGDNPPDPEHLKLQDRWILLLLNETIKKVSRSLDLFKFNEAINLIYEFFWRRFCDWYVEMAKSDIKDLRVQETLLYVLKTSLKLLNPFMPFITDEIASRLPGKKFQTLACEAWPIEQKGIQDKDSRKAMDLVFKTVLSLRNMRVGLALPSQTEIRIQLSTDAKHKAMVEGISDLIKKLVNVKELIVMTEKSVPKNSLSSLVSQDVHLYFLLEGLLDSQKEIKRLEGEIANLKAQLKRKTAMLKNKDFVKKAPKAVVDNERKKEAELKESIQRLKEVRRAFK